ncbi:hypothetical protein [Neobacillus sp. LXY-4]|uniref:hypothetical protein n=1 Tax=Neobacillus sp. LXY-4 TaxID=3379826 RepID=UPI003EE08893
MPKIKQLILHSENENIIFKFVGFENKGDYGMVTASYLGTFRTTIAHGFDKPKTLKNAIIQLKDLNN